MAAQPVRVPQLKIATAEVKQDKKDGPLFYILPPLLVVAVFVYCLIATPPAPQVTEEQPSEQTEATAEE